MFIYTPRGGGAALPQALDTTAAPQFARIGIGTAADAVNTFTLLQAAATSGTPTAFSLTGGAHTGLTASTEVISANFNFAQTRTWATGALATQRTVVFQAGTLAFAGASTVTNAATVAITGAPTAGTNATITNPYSLWTQAGNARFDGTTTYLGTSSTVANISAFNSGTSIQMRGNQGASSTLIDTIVGSQATKTVTVSSGRLFGIVNNATTVFNTYNHGGYEMFQQPIAGGTSATRSCVVINAGAHSAMAASTELVDCDFLLNRTVQFNTGALTTQRAFLVRGPTYGFVAASQLDDAVTFEVTAAPAAGTNATITRAWAARLQGSVRLGGGVTFNRTATAATTTAVFADYIIGVTSTAAARTINLPAAASVGAGKVYIVKDESGGAATNNITIDANGTETIDGALTAVISANYGSLGLYTDGSNWFII